MPNPVTDHRMYELGGNSHAKWLFLVVRQECFFKRQNRLTRPLLEAMCRQHQVPIDAIDELTTVLGADGNPLFLEQIDEQGFYFRLASDWYDPRQLRREAGLDAVPSTERVQRHRREKEEELAAASGDSHRVVDAGLAEMGRNFETVSNSSGVGGKLGDGLNSDFETVSPLHVTSHHEVPPSGAVEPSRARAKLVITRDMRDAVYAAWRGAMDEEYGAGKVKRNPSPKRDQAIDEALRREFARDGDIGRVLGKCCAAVRGWRYDDWPKRRVDRNDITDCLRPANIDRFAEWELDLAPRPRQLGDPDRTPPAAPQGGKVARNAAAATELRERAARMRAARGGG